MTKTLTEKWHDGDMKGGIYYCKTKSYGEKKLWFHHRAYDGMYVQTYGTEEMFPEEDIIEVLAPVPSYEEYKNLQEENNKLADLITDINNKWLKTIKEKKKLEKQVKMVEVKGKVK